MTKDEIIKELAEGHQVERMVFKMLPASKNPFDCPQDLIQDIYILLLQKDEDLIVSLYDKGQLGFFILKIVKNNLLSKNSRYFYQYIKLRSLSDGLEKAKDFSAEDRGGVQ